MVMEGSDMVGGLILTFLIAWLIARALKQRDEKGTPPRTLRELRRRIRNGERFRLKEDEHSKPENWR